jgi:hypothetical protein
LACVCVEVLGRKAEGRTDFPTKPDVRSGKRNQQQGQQAQLTEAPRNDRSGRLFAAIEQGLRRNFYC